MKKHQKYSAEIPWKTMLYANRIAEEIWSRDGQRGAIVELTVCFLPVGLQDPLHMTRQEVEAATPMKTRVKALAVIDATGKWNLQPTTEYPEPIQYVRAKAWQQILIESPATNAGNKSIQGGHDTVNRRFGSVTKRKKQRARWQAYMNKVYRKLCRVEPGKRPSHSQLSRVVSLYFQVPVYTVRRYTVHPDKK